MHLLMHMEAKAVHIESLTNAGSHVRLSSGGNSQPKTRPTTAEFPEVDTLKDLVPVCRNGHHTPGIPRGSGVHPSFTCKG